MQIPEQNRRRIKNMFPEPRLQIRFLRFLFFASSIQILATSLTLYVFLSQSYQMITNHTLLSNETHEFLRTELNSVFYFICGTFVLFLIGIMAIGVLYSQRIGGMIYALKRTLKEINSGKDVLLRLRKGDDQDDLVEEFNRMLRAFRAQKAQHAKSA